MTLEEFKNLKEGQTFYFFNRKEEDIDKLIVEAKFSKKWVISGGKEYWANNDLFLPISELFLSVEQSKKFIADFLYEERIKLANRISSIDKLMSSIGTYPSKFILPTKL